METYEEIYQRMKNAYEQNSGNRFNEESDIAIRLKVLAGEIYNSQVNMDWLKRQMFSATASGEYLDYLASQRGLKRRQAVKAKGELTFFISQATDHTIIIPKGTVVATADSEPLRFVTVEDEEISQGNVLVSIYAEAEKAGSNGNIGTARAVIGVSVPADVESVSNRSAFSGGEDEESDEELRERIKKSYLNQSNGTNAAFYEQLALSVEGIAKAGVVGRARGTGTVNIYVCGKSAAVSDETVQNAVEVIGKARELNVDVAVYKAQFVNYNLNIVAWHKRGYTSAEVQQKCTKAFKDYIYSIPIGGKLYLSALGKYLLATGCIENYQYNTDMFDTSCAQSQCFAPGDITIEVK